MKSLKASVTQNDTKTNSNPAEGKVFTIVDQAILRENLSIYKNESNSKRVMK